MKRREFLKAILSLPLVNKLIPSKPLHENDTISACNFDYEQYRYVRAVWVATDKPGQFLVLNEYYNEKP